jgi:bacillithiol synthase
MDCKSTRLPYRQTQSFSKIVLDYIDQADPLKSFYSYSPSISGIRKAIDARKNFPTDRHTLVKALRDQYQNVPASAAVLKNIDSLLSPSTFTITTAHQNNIFTGPLYFIYKIIHAVALADQLNRTLNDFRFVPVFYMGSEDADMDELNHIFLDGEKLEWKTKQKGAVGQMKIDKDLTNLVKKISGRLQVLPYGPGIVTLITDCYKEGERIQDATFKFINAIFGEYGILVLMADTAPLKKIVSKIFKDDLLNQSALPLVEKTGHSLESLGYKVQATPRAINLFYLVDGTRERIEAKNNQYAVLNTAIVFTEQELLDELTNHPERFSPNVILRGIYQELLLPNIAFIGGGGELSYWLELKELFDHYRVPFPVLVLRNSFLVLEKKHHDLMGKLELSPEDLFLSADELLNRIVMKHSDKKLQLNGSFTETEALYDQLIQQASAVDITLEKHVAALKSRSLTRLKELEKKILRAEKRKFSDQQRQLQKLKNELFPGNGLQDRHANLLYYYALWGPDFIKKLYEESLGLEQEFTIIEKM